MSETCRLTCDCYVTGGDTYEYSYGNKLIYAAITVNLTLNSDTLGYPKGLPYRDAWEEYISNKVGVKGIFFFDRG